MNFARNKIDQALKLASRIPSIPGLNLLSPTPSRIPTEEEVEGFRSAQLLAKKGVGEVAKMISDGWTEIQAAELLNTWLRDHNVNAFFHKAFVWWGDRTRFEGVKNYTDYLPSNRVLLPGEVFILDVAPIVDGYICDVGFTGCLAENKELDAAKLFLKELWLTIPKLFSQMASGSEIWKTIDQMIKDEGYENIHNKYPFSVLGHRVYSIKANTPEVGLINFGWQSYWSLLSRGLFGQLLNSHHDGNLKGLWAIEPHIGTNTFGAKFEEILLVTDQGARWIETSANPISGPKKK